jgi:phosphomannomutase/phosphoglucomutase
MDRHIFREYDIRGVVDQDLTEADVSLLSRAIGTFLKRRGRNRITLGRDCRLSSEGYRDLMVEGLTGCGLQVLDLGVCPTPLLYFSIRHFKTDGGVMITASHNPPIYNGFKVCDGPDTIFGAEIMGLYDLAMSGDFETGPGGLTSEDVIGPYLEFVKQNVKLARPLKIALDGGNAVAGPVGLPLLRALGAEVTPLYCEMDGTFPNHPPDPTVPDNVKDMIRTVLDNKLDCGIGYDGDGDRIGVADEHGHIIYGDMLLLIFAREILRTNPGATFVSEVKASQFLYDDITAKGGRAIMWRTGHSLIKAKMKEVHASLAGEMSGHMFFADRYYGYDDAIYSSARLLEILSATDRPLSSFLADVPVRFTTPEIRVECPDEIKFKVVDKVAALARARGLEFIDVDGVRLTFPDAWGLVRASNTQPVLVLRFEAPTEARAHEIRELVEELIAEAKKG